MENDNQSKNSQNEFIDVIQDTKRKNLNVFTFSESVWSVEKGTMTMFIAEVLGTGILLFVGCMGSIGTMGSIPPPLQSSMAFGMTVNLLIMVNMRQTLKKKENDYTENFY